MSEPKHINNLYMKKVIFVLSFLNVLFAQQDNNVFTGTLKNGLIGYWPFSGNAHDASGNGYNGTVNGATLTSDRFGNSNSAYYFDGLNDYINIGNNTAFNLNNITISVWYNESRLPPNGSSDALVSKSTSNSGQIGYRIEIAPDGNSYYVLSQMGIVQPNKTGHVQSPPVNLTTWENIIIVRNGSTVTFYKNGKNVGSNSTLSAPVFNTNNLLFGALTDLSITGFFDGKLDDIAIWNRALATEEIDIIFDYSPSKNTQKIETNEDYFFSTNSTWSNKNIQDSLTKLIPSKNQKSIIKLVKDLSKVDSQKRLNSSIDNLYNYFFFQSSNQNQTIAFVREIQYFLNLTKNDINFYDYYESEITNFIDSANNYLNSRILTEFKSAIPQTESYSKLWMNLLKMESYPWVKILRYEDDFNTIVYQPIVNIYFERFKKLNGITEQKELVDDFTIHFPKMNEDAEVLTFIFFKINDDQCNGDFKLFNYNFFSQWVNNELDPLQNIPWWIAKNEKDENEISAIYSILNDSITLWKFSLCQKKLCGIVEAHKNDQLYFQMKFDDIDSEYHSDRPNSLMVFENQNKYKEVYFDWHYRYSFYFKNGINITEKGVMDTLNIAMSLTKFEDPDFKKALALISSLEWHHFPDTLALYIKIDSTQKEIERLRRNDLIIQVEKLLTETDTLILKNKFKEGRDKLQVAEKFALKLKIQDNQPNKVLSKNDKNSERTKLSDENDIIFMNLSKDIDNKRDELLKKEIEFLEMTDRNKIQEILTQGKKLKLVKSYSQAITLYDKTIFEYQMKNYPEIQTLKAELAVLNKLLQDDQEANRIKIIENKKIKLINELQFTTIGKVEISKNYLNVIEFTNGDPIYYASSPEEFARKTIEKTPVYCYYNFDKDFEDKGIYYNIYALHDPGGRTLFPDDFRLPFESEMAYVYGYVRKQNKEIIDFLFTPNTKTKFNGYNQIEYENSTVEYTYGLNPHATFSPSTISKPPYGLSGTTDPKHMFWILPDFKIESGGDIEQYPGFFECDFQSKTTSNHFSFSICEIARERNYSNHDIIFSNHANLEELDANPLKKSQFKLIAAQIKLVKQRPLMTSGDWLPNSTSKRLANKYVIYQNGIKTETTNIFEAKNSKEWFEYCDKELPACVSYEFNSKNDLTHGLIYNEFVFENGNYPLVNESKNLEIIDLSNAKYIIGGNSEYFYEYLTDKIGLKNGARLKWNKETQKPEFYNYALHGKYNQETDYFFLKETNLNRYTYKDNYNIVYFYVYQYLNEYKLNFSSMNFYDKFGGFSIRYMKK